jgi:hypothetical protein
LFYFSIDPWLAISCWCEFCWDIAVLIIEAARCEVVPRGVTVGGVGMWVNLIYQTLIGSQTHSAVTST